MILFLPFFVSHVLFLGKIQRFAGNGNLAYSCIVSKTCHTITLSEGEKRIRFFFFFALILLYYTVGDIGINKLNMVSNSIPKMIGNWF